jgi:hypothetical protein
MRCPLRHVIRGQFLERVFKPKYRKKSLLAIHMYIVGAKVNSGWNQSPPVKTAFRAIKHKV